MPFPFNRRARGLLGLLDAKTGGQTPQELIEALHTTVDAWPLYYAEMRTHISGTTPGPLGVGYSGFTVGDSMTVPNDEIWRVFHYAVQVNTVLGAGQNVLVVPSALLAVDSGTPLRSVTLTSNRFLATITGQLATSCADVPFTLLPGDSLTVLLEIVTGLATTVNGAAEIMRLKI